MTSVDETSDEATFSGRLLDILNKSVVGSCIALGSSLGIFDIMCTFKTPQTYEAIAAKGDWKPRYIKEWLNTMVCGDIIEYNKQDDTYFIPEYRRPVLSKSGGLKNSAVTLELLPVVNSVYNELAPCMDKKGPDGISDEHYLGFHEWKNKLADGLISWKNLHLAFTQVPGVLQKLESGARICDAGCSSGYLTIIMAENLPNSTVVGIDISQHAIELAREKAKDKGVKNVSFEVMDVCDFPKAWESTMDIFVAINLVHDLPFPEKCLKSVWAALQTGGQIFMIDTYLHSNVADSKQFSYAPWFYGLSLFHCIPVSMDTKGGAGLGCTWGIEKQQAILESTGFTDVKRLDGGPGSMSYHVGYKPNNLDK